MIKATIPPAPQHYNEKKNPVINWITGFFVCKWL